jgi:spermidine synthase
MIRCAIRINRRNCFVYNFKKLTEFPEDMAPQKVEINRLDNQILVRYFDEEWSKI